VGRTVDKINKRGSEDLNKTDLAGERESNVRGQELKLAV